MEDREEAFLEVLQPVAFLALQVVAQVLQVEEIPTGHPTVVGRAHGPTGNSQGS